MNNLEYVACPTTNCGGQWLPVDKIKQLRESHATFFCPSGHSQWYTQKSEAEKLREEITRLIRERDHWKSEYCRVSEEKRAARRKQYALKGVITKLKKAS